MQAAIDNEYGPPEVVKLLEGDKPAAKDNELSFVGVPLPMFKGQTIKC